MLTDDAKDSEVELLIDHIHQASNDEKERIAKVEKTEIHKKNFLGKEHNAIKVFVNNHKDAQTIASEIGESDIILARREYDISLVSKYIMEKKINPLQWYEFQGTPLKEDEMDELITKINIDTCIKLESIKEVKDDEIYTPNILAYDIETNGIDMDKGVIYMIALYGENYKKVLTWKGEGIQNDHTVQFKSEEEMLKAFVETVKEQNPDILCGYFSDGFDLPFIRQRAKVNKVKLNLGMDNSIPVFSRGKVPSAKIAAIVHVDIYRFISAVYAQYLSTESLSLNAVANELIGETKDDFSFAILNNIEKMTKDDWKKFIDYNLQDTKVTYQLMLKIWPDIFEFTKIMKEPIFEVTRNRMATHVENYLLHNLDRFNEIAEKRPGAQEIGRRRSLPAYEGAFVYEPTPGLYENIAFFDFTSMYGSVIVSYNLSKATCIIQEDGEYTFAKKQGFFPILLEEIIEKRKHYKKEYATKKDNIAKAASNAYKLLANAAYGYLAFFGARYYSREAATATAKFARDNIHTAIDKIEKEGYKILYSDTDSIAFEQGEKTQKEVMKFLEVLNENLPGIMELDLEDFYKRGLFVAKRGGEKGAKKKYALLDSKDQMKIRGFETIRRDWCAYSRTLQSEILESILHDGNQEKAREMFDNAITKLKEGKVDIKELLVRTQLKKSLKDYKSKGPHVIAAEKMQKRDIPISTGMVIEYYISDKKGKNIGDKVLLPDEEGKYDIKYYLENQIVPPLESIFEIFDVDISGISADGKQTTLF
ncbi:MAG: DNA polymerase I [Patescibacteria group bacterium]